MSARAQGGVTTPHPRACPSLDPGRLLLLPFSLSFHFHSLLLCLAPPLD